MKQRRQAGADPPGQARAGRGTDGTHDDGSHRSAHGGTDPRSDRAGEPLVLTGASLTTADVEDVARGGRRVILHPGARSRIAEARGVIDGLVATGAVVYGVTTGFGDLATTFIQPADTAQLQRNLLVSHAVGVGEPLPDDVVRAMLLLRANTLALGHSGCRPVVVDRLLALLDAGISPVVPSRGSVGASGDLAPLAHLALPLIGRGTVRVAPPGGGEADAAGAPVAAAEALAVAGIEPLVLEAKEGLALLNGTQLMGAIGALLLADADRLVATASVAAAMTVEALLGTDVAFAEAYQLARPHPGQIEIARQLRRLLRVSTLMASHHPQTHKVQDPYSLRCVPQVHGAVLSALDYLRDVLDVELNAATDNPLVFPDGRVADPPRRRRVAAGSSAVATSTASRSRSPWTSRSSRSPSSGRSASGGQRCSWTAGCRAACPRSSPPKAA